MAGNAFDTITNIVSIHGFCAEDWSYLYYSICHFQWIELNLSCPNVGLYNYQKLLKDVFPITEYRPMDLIAKLPPLDWFALAEPLYTMGIRYFHLCNTIQTPGGGLSGKVLKQYSLWAIKEFRQKWGDTIKIIGGGGITNTDDIYDYMEAGADHIALGSMLFNPMNHSKIPIFIENVKEYKGNSHATV
jgi:dihydroorotate dehydrogenase